MIKIAHISDNHSVLLPFPKEEYDVIVHSGDFLPNESRYKKIPTYNEEVSFQRNWLITNEKRLVEWIEDKLFLFCSGNPDYDDPTILMRKFGINAINITNCAYTYKDVTFYGFPYIPWTGAFWNYETFPADMAKKFETVVNYINDGTIDVLVCHSPPVNYLDKDNFGTHFGSTAIDNALKYKVNRLPKLMLVGHIHQGNGFADYPSSDADEKMLISNAATTIHILSFF